jgi:hypothetical protein
LSEQELRDGLKLAVTDEPPMKFDLDELVDTAERITRRRRALIAVGASTAAVAVAAVAIPVVLGISGGGEPIPLAGPPNPAVSTGSLTPAQPPKAKSLTRTELVARGAEMQAHLRTQLSVVVPGAKQVEVGLFGGEAEGAVADGQGYLGSFVSFTLRERTSIEVHVQNDQENMERTCDGCQPVRQQDGSLVLVDPVESVDGNPDMKITSAVHFRNDGSAVRVTTYNYDPTTQTAPVYEPDVALSVDQITRLAVDPALHL